MKKLLYICALVGIATSGYAQQLPVESQFMFSKVLVNPGVRDVDQEGIVWLKHRSQWVGFEDAPRTQLFGYNQALKNNKMIVGGYFFNDRYGPIRNSGFNINYSYHLDLNDDDLKLGLGLGLGLYQFAINGDLVRLHDQDDALVNESNNGRTWVPDASFGAYLYDKNWYAGLSILHLMRNKVNPYKANDIYANLASVHHYYLTGGYRHELNDEHAVKPNLLVDYIEGNILHMNLGVQWEYKKMMDLGLAWSTKDAIVFTSRFVIKENVQFSYSYDMTISKLRNYNSGSHEFMLGYRIKEKPGRKKTKSYM